MDKPIYRMSSAGKCPRALSAIRLGYEPEAAPEWLERAAEEGNWHEDRIKQGLREGDGETTKLDVYDEQLELTLEYPSFTLIGHIDGKVRNIPYYFNVNAPENKLLEIKTMSQFEFDRSVNTYTQLQYRCGPQDNNY